MTVRILSSGQNRETRNAEKFRDALLASEPQLANPDIVADILYNLYLPGREIDLVLLYHDRSTGNLQFKTSNGKAIHSFVMILEVKNHSPDQIRFEGSKVQVRYDQQWHDATDQCMAQVYALKNYQKQTYFGNKRREDTFVQKAIWLARAPRSAFSGDPAKSSVPVHFAEIKWQEIVDGFQLPKKRDEVRTLIDNLHPNPHSNTPQKERNRGVSEKLQSNQFQYPEYHSIESLRELFTYEVCPTRLDKDHVNALTQTRFDAEKTAYIQNLGKGLLMLRGRGGTGKTFALVQIALHLARKGKKTILLTEQHGLIADIERRLRLIKKKETKLDPFPVIGTRYRFVQKVFEDAFGKCEEKKVRGEISCITDRENFRVRELSKLKERDICKLKEFDFVLIDEGQDWSEDQRDLMYKIFNVGHVVVADGVNQFVGQDRCKWDLDNVTINRRHSLRVSRRNKAAVCQTVAEIARELKLSDWDIEPDTDMHGGRFSVIIEPSAPLAVERSLEILKDDLRKDDTLKEIDNLVCLPSSNMAMGINYSELFDRAIKEAGRDSWRGFYKEDRRNYPMRESQLRAVLYNSCRGMEGYTTICLGLDRFFDFQLKNPRIDEAGLEVSERNLFSLQSDLEDSVARKERLFAVNWLMIPLTRSIDHLVVHLVNEDSELCTILRRIDQRLPGAIDWIGS